MRLRRSSDSGRLLATKGRAEGRIQSMSGRGRRAIVKRAHDHAMSWQWKRVEGVRVIQCQEISRRVDDDVATETRIKNKRRWSA